MDAFIYQADIYCEDCGEAIKAEIVQAHRHTLSEDNMLKDDSDAWPQGPYSEGGGEADCPQHCGRCGTFLDNPLTGEGETYVRDAWREFIDTGRGHIDTLAEWKAGYDWVWMDFESITLEGMREEGLTDLAERRATALEAA